MKANRRRSSTSSVLALAFALGIACHASAHAPLPRQVVVTPDAASIAIDLPGFGLVFRARPEQPFVYACSALFEQVTTADSPPLAFRADGALLVGGPDGIRTLDPDGCPGPLDTAAFAPRQVTQLVLAPRVPADGVQTGYALTSTDDPALWRTDDGGRNWTHVLSFGAPPGSARRPTGLALRADRPEQVYWSSRDAEGTWLHWSDTGGNGANGSLQGIPLTLLHAEGNGSSRLWASAPDGLTVGNRGLAILRAEGPEGPWQTMLRVNYFGGFVVDPQGVIWVGDEIGGVYRSRDGGETFENLEADADVACVAYGGNTLWACNPAGPQEPVLQVLQGGESPFSGVVALNAVDQLLACPGLDVAQVCANAWVEWQRDVLMRPPETPPVPMENDAGTSPDPSSSRGSDCSVHAARSDIPHGLMFSALALCVRLARRKRRAPRTLRHDSSEEPAT